MTSQSILLYLLKTILVSGILLAYYWTALRDKKFHYYNRFYLLSSSVLSLVVPLLNFDWFTVEEPALIYSSNELIQFVLPTTTVQNGIHLDWADYVLITTGLITIALLGLLLFQIFKIQFLKNRSEVTKMDGFDFINTNEENAPFSFLNNLFWKQSISLQEEGGQQIFKHEITHIQQKHTWDRIYCQIIASIFWMNPFNWIIQKELVAIHEFIADEEAVGNSNVADFAKMLLQTHYGNHFLNPTHSFFYSSIKRRLAMLTQTSNPTYSYLRRVMVLPVLVITISLVSIKVHAREKIENKVESIKSQIISLISDTTKPTIISIKADTVDQRNKPVYFVEGVKISEQEMNAISPDNIKSINVLKGESAIKKYSNDGKNGVVEIFLKDLQRKDQLPNKDWSNIDANKNQIKSLEMANGVKIEFKGKFNIDTAVGDKKTPLYILDGVPLKTSIELSKLNPAEFESVSVLKNPSSISLYGIEGKNGVILITTKKGLTGNLQNKSDEIKVFEYSAKEGLNGDVYYKKMDGVKVKEYEAKAGLNGNLQNKMEDVTVIGYSGKEDKAEVVTVMNVPKFQKNTERSRNNDPIFYTVQKPAEFPGGSEGWSNYLMKNLNHDLLYKNKAVPGKYTVKLNFVVNSNGDVENVIPENNPGYGSAAEAIRVIINGPKWIPAEQNGKKVNYLMKQVIVFNVTGK
jgi:TonB-dependent SusC/RagA subfamily outer membrane receptor